MFHTTDPLPVIITNLDDAFPDPGMGSSTQLANIATNTSQTNDKLDSIVTTLRTINNRF